MGWFKKFANAVLALMTCCYKGDDADKERVLTVIDGKVCFSDELLIKRFPLRDRAMSCNDMRKIGKSNNWPLKKWKSQVSILNY